MRGFLAVPTLSDSLERVRTSLKLSLWTWAVYWPAMGVMLGLGGMTDPASLVVAACATGGLVLLLASGALRATASRSVREFFIERPMYLLAAAVLFVIVGAALPVAARVGLFLFSGAYLASLLLFAFRVWEHARANGGFYKSRLDQALIVTAIMLPGAIAVFLDSILAAGVGNPATTVAAINWLALLYPPLILLATRGVREPLSFRRDAKIEPKPTPVAE
jgi:hypothetical protein